jgi:hypothetical protein
MRGEATMRLFMGQPSLDDFAGFAGSMSYFAVLAGRPRGREAEEGDEPPKTRASFTTNSFT